MNERAFSELKDQKREQNTAELDFKQRVLARAILLDDMQATAQYTRNEQGSIISDSSFSDANYQELISRFRQNPQDCLAVGRENIFAIATDTNLSSAEKARRVDLYLDAFLQLQIKLDHKVFLPDETKIYDTLPEYVPDGMSDMGTSPELDPRVRVESGMREKIRVDKQKMFEKARPLLREFFMQGFSQKSNYARKMAMVSKIAEFVYTEMPYNYEDRVPENRNETIRLHQIQEQELAVCRHHALYDQILNQTMGVTSRLFKCRLDTGTWYDSGPHAANLVRMENRWHLVDTTNPEIIDGKITPFIFLLPDSTIDLINHDYLWKIPTSDGKGIRTYTSRRKIFYRIMDNAK